MILSFFSNTSGTFQGKDEPNHNSDENKRKYFRKQFLLRETMLKCRKVGGLKV